MKSLPTLSIGIPAYNEEANIAILLKNLLTQQQYKDVVLKEIIIVSDASTDATDTHIKKIKDKRIFLYRNKYRLGCPLTQNVLVKKATGDIFVLLNADTTPASLTTINDLARNIVTKNKDYVIAKALPVTGKNHFEKAINMSVFMRTSLFESINNADTAYLCGGRGRALSKNLYKKIHWESVVGEDVYAFLYAKYYGFTTWYSKETIMLFTSPDNLKDHAKQSNRFTYGFSELYPFFTKEFVDQWTTIPKFHAIRIYLEYFFKNPILFINYLYISFYVRFLSKTLVSSTWEPSPSSKKAIHV